MIFLFSVFLIIEFLKKQFILLWKISFGQKELSIAVKQIKMAKPPGWDPDGFACFRGGKTI